MNRKLLVISLLLLLMVPTTLSAQKKSTTQKEVSPYIEGRQKVRKTDYDSVWKFTIFGTKQKYYCDYDYSQLITETARRKPNYGNFETVMNFLLRNPRSPLRLCAIYALNPSVRDDAERAELRSTARAEALEALQALQARMTEDRMKNKLQIAIAEVDYRYWQGTAFYAEEQTDEPLIHVGLILYFGTKKIDLFPSSADGTHTFKDIKFFPNDATVQESWYSLLDELAQYMKENERIEVLLTGYTDNQGTAAYMEGLSRQRANEVKKQLVARGVEEYRIEIEAKGSANPVGDNETLEGRVANNRCSITIQ